MAKKEKLMRTTVLLTAVIILSKVFGLARDMLTAGYFGTGVENDAYASAYSLFYLPVLLFNSCITATIVPLFVEQREQRSLAHANRFASNAINLFCLAALVVSALLYIFAEPIVRLIFRFDARGVELTVRMSRIMMLGLVFNVLSITISSLLNAMERFMAAQLTGFPLSVAVMASVVIFSDRLGVESIAWGVFAASILQVVIQIPFMFRWFRYSPVVNLRDERFHRLLRLAGPAVLSMGISEINHMVDRSLASGLAAGSISAMNYAYKLITFLLGVLMVPLTTIMFSRMSRQAAANNREGMLASLRQSVQTILMIALPIIGIAVILGQDVVSLIYKRGSFTDESVLLTSSVLFFYLLGVPSFGMRDFLNRTFHSMQDTKTPFRIACLVVVSNIILNFILRRYMGARGLAFATSIASFIGTITMFVLLSRRMNGLGLRKILPDTLKIILATVIAMGSCMSLNSSVFPGTDTLSFFLRLLIIGGVSLITYLAACIALRVEALRIVWGRLFRRAPGSRLKKK